MECWSFLSLKSKVQSQVSQVLSLSPAPLALVAPGGIAATEDLTQRPWGEWDCGKVDQDLTSAQAKLSVVVQGLRSQGQAGLLLLLSWRRRRVKAKRQNHEVVVGLA